MGRKKPDSPTLLKRREEALRPCATLGYDHESVARHLIERGAFKIAEVELRRAIWLNPYEARFKKSLALCLHRQGRDDEALTCLHEVPMNMLDDGETAALVCLIGWPGRKAER